MRNVVIRHKSIIAAIVMVLVLIQVELLSTYALAQSSAPPPTVREVQFIYHTDLTGIDPKAHHVEAWIPLPREDRFQRVSALSIDSPAHVEMIDQPTGGNRVAHLSANAPLPQSIPVTIRFKVRRVEEAADPAQAQRNLPEPTDGKFAGYLGPDHLVPIDGEIARVSAKVGDANGSSYEQARAIYSYVIANMAYDKSGTGWGRGDAIYACNVKKGNCTDFHSLFIAIARSRGIPARFTIGFPLSAASAGTIPGYHCWAEFYAGGQWVPVDASEAWKHPQLRAYYFGHLDADRVAFTMGRDLVLVPRQQGEPLNFLIYPYVEVDGKPLSKAQIKNRFEYAAGSQIASGQ
ncbi:MAG TPA: transglutaminase domain-containing protein [Candidatus Binataceae bacterium]